ncbi:MAG TPA: hypothetical protein VGK73_09620 [Polyangiaceae bacterium]
MEGLKGFGLAAALCMTACGAESTPSRTADAGGGAGVSGGGADGSGGSAGLAGGGKGGSAGSGAVAGAAGVGGVSGPAEISCEPWVRVPIGASESVLINNFWNEAWAEGKPYSQCLLRRTTDAGEQYGWNWSWPEYKPYSSYAAPEALFGWKAWDGGASTTTQLPRRIDAIESLELDFAAEVAAGATHNFNATMWITATDTASATKNPADIRSEIMVWFADPADLAGGTFDDGEVSIGGVDFHLWHVVNQPDASGGTTHTWTMLTYAAKNDRYRGSFDLKLVLNDAVERGLVEPEYAVGGVELITEVFGGSGELWLERFDVSVNGE